MRVEIIGGDLAPADLQSALARSTAGMDIRFDIDRPVSQYRTGPGAAVVVALVSGGATALSALITGVFALASSNRNARRGAEGIVGGRVVIHGADGSSVECPADATPEDLDRLVELTRKLSRPTIELP